MRQRVMIAIAMANDPELLIADEPTTALDVTIQAQVMKVLARVRETTGAAMVLITHDLGLVAETADRVAVMYGGRMMEQAPVGTVFSDPRHPYTVGLIVQPAASRSHCRRALFDSRPGARISRGARRLRVSSALRPVGRASACRRGGAGVSRRRDRSSLACHFAEETPALARERQPRRHRQPASARAGGDETRRALQVEGLSKDFRIRRAQGFGHDELQRRSRRFVRAGKGRTLGLVGKSGCGKSTLGRVILRLHRSDARRRHLKGEEITGMRPARCGAKRKELQVVFQDPYASLDPRMTIHEVIAEPLRINGRYSPERVIELLGHVGLAPEAARDGRPSSPAVSASASPLPARSRSVRMSWCSTRRSPRSMSRSRPRSSIC